MERVMLESKDRLRENYIDFLYRHRDEILMECRQLQLRRPGDPHPWSGEVPKYQSIDPTQKYNDNEDSPLAGVISSFLSLCIQECETGADDGPGKRLSRWIGKTQELGLRLPDLVESLLNLKQIIHRFATERLYCKPLEVKYLNRTIDTLFDYSLFQLSLAFSRNGKDNLRTTLPGEDPHRDRDDRLKILTTLSHELHTPLTSIIGYADDLIESIDESGDQKNTEIREHASRILSNARYLMEIIRNSMEWSRLEIQETSLTPESFDLKECIFEVLTTLSRMLAEKGIRAVLRTPAEFPRPYADYQRTKQVLLNLLTNAVKYTPAHGKIAVEVAPFRRKEGSEGTSVSQFLKITVIDNGIGIDRNELPHIFEEFQRGRGKATGEADGVGLGLFIAKRLVELQGGQIWSKSRPHKGSRFSFTLPTVFHNIDQVSNRPMAKMGR